MNKIGVIGSLNMDTIIQVEKMPEEGENIFLEAIENSFGGKGGNAAIALKKLNCDVCFFSCLGNDYDAELIKENLSRYGIDTSNIKISENYKTGAAYIFLEKNGNNRIIVNPGANMDINGADIRNVFKREMADCTHILIQLEISIEAVKEIISVCNELNIKLVIDVSPNKSELEALVKRKLHTLEEIKSAGKELLNNGIKNVLVKMGENGSLFLNSETEIYQKVYKVDTVDTTAAGDSYMAGFVKSLSEKNSLKEAMNYGSICGAIAVTKIGAVPSLPSLKDIENFTENLKERRTVTSK